MISAVLNLRPLNNMPLKVSCRANDNDKHEWDITFLLFYNGKLYSAADDGKIKLWSQDLEKLADVQAHPCSVFCLAASENTLFSCSDDGTIKLWELDTLKAKETLVKNERVEFSRVAYSAGCLFSGDNQGTINIYKDKELYGEVNIEEPIKDMLLFGTLVFTVRDLYLLITELKLEGKEIQFETKAALMGRAPVTFIGENLFAFITREGKEIQLHENNAQNGFKQVARETRASDLIINALSGVKWGDEEQFFSGGWDKTLKQWRINQNYPTNEGNIDVDIVINAIACGEKNQIFVGGSDGHIIRVDVSS